MSKAAKATKLDPVTCPACGGSVPDTGARNLRCEAPITHDSRCNQVIKRRAADGTAIPPVLLSEIPPPTRPEEIGDAAMLLVVERAGGGLRIREFTCPGHAITFEGLDLAPEVVDVQLGKLEFAIRSRFGQ